ncbi:DUF5020 family protein [Pontiellaceae bacterium B12219]|nr:DUF5020 family protein [Pontiellaceae bacterium B12219]
MNRTLLSVLLCSATTLSFAGDFIQWQDTSLTGLYGTGFEVDPETQETLTIEYANGWKWGDFFWFNDLVYFNGDENGFGNKTSYYGEIAPRFSFNKMTGKDLSVAFVKDWLIATCYEYGHGVNGDDYGHNLLVGAGVDLDVPAFDFVQLNLYQRFDLKGDNGESLQLTAVWKYSTPVAKSTFIFDGFIDWVMNSDGSYEKNLHICPQLKFDIGALCNMEGGKLLAGVEYDYWKNKYGIKDGNFGLDTDQNAISGIVQYHF